MASVLSSARCSVRSNTLFGGPEPQSWALAGACCNTIDDPSALAKRTACGVTGSRPFHSPAAAAAAPNVWSTSSARISGCWGNAPSLHAMTEETQALRSENEVRVAAGRGVRDMPLSLSVYTILHALSSGILIYHLSDVSHRLLAGGHNLITRVLGRSNPITMFGRQNPTVSQSRLDRRNH